jgi:hypothetical protein
VTPANKNKRVQIEVDGAGDPTSNAVSSSQKIPLPLLAALCHIVMMA